MTAGRKTPHTAYKPGQSGNPRGRPKGSYAYRDLLTAEDRAKIADAAGCTPLQFMLSVMLDKDHSIDTRVDVAKAAAPYMHRRMPIAVELPNQPTQVDVAKLLALPREEREVLLGTLTKLGVNLGVGSPMTTGAMPTVTPALNGIWAKKYENADAAGRPIAPSVARAKALQSHHVRDALAAGKGVSGAGEAVPLKQKKPPPEDVPLRGKYVKKDKDKR